MLNTGTKSIARTQISAKQQRKTHNQSVKDLEKLVSAESNLAQIYREVRAEEASKPLIRPSVQPLTHNATRHGLWYFAADCLALTLAFVVAFCCAALINSVYLGRDFNPFASGEWQYRMLQLGALGAVLLLWFKHTAHYRLRMPFWIEAKQVLLALLLIMMADGFMQFASKEDFSRSWLIFGWGFAAVAILIIRALMRHSLRQQKKWDVATLLVGAGPLAKDAKAALQADPNLGYKIVGQINNLDEALAEADGSWGKLCEYYDAEYVAVALEGGDLADAEPHFASLMRENVPFAVVPPLRQFPVHGMRPYYFFNHNVMLWVRASGLDDALSQFVKRTADVVLSSTALLLLSPIMILIAVLVKLDGGPAFFPDERLGRNGRLFKCLKFRSMILNADQVLQDYLAKAPKEIKEEWLAFKKLRKYDPRVTPIGRLLRKTSLDEIPQLINVLIGDMSLVGPRPILMRELDAYDSDIALYYKVRPGITGLWQVSGRNQVTYARRVEMDSWYIRNWSLWHDIAIICKTIPVLLLRKGAF